MESYDILVIGGGVAGLSCAAQLEKALVNWCLLEASDRLGGRVATENVEGFLLDRGFQVLLTAYPEVRRQLNLKHLRLKPYASGARIWCRGRWHTLADPRRHPTHLLATLSNPALSPSDMLATLRWLWKARRPALAADWADPLPTARYLLQLGFHQPLIDAFWRPFLGGVFLDPALQRPRALADFVFRFFATGKAAIPAEGMGAVIHQLTAALPKERLRLRSEVTHIENQQVYTRNAKPLTAKHIVLAGASPQCLQTATSPFQQPQPDFLGTVCDYFAVPTLPKHAAFLHLIPHPTPLTIAFPTALHPTMAPTGQHLLAVSHAIGPASANAPIQTTAQILAALRLYCGPQSSQWRPIKRFVIPRALPLSTTLPPDPTSYPPNQPLYHIGDAHGLPSLNSAMYQGRTLGKILASHKGVRLLK